jgi:hexosaminidase
MPEIDVPGHSLAVIACFPELSCSNKPVQVNGGWKFYNVEDNALNPSNPKVYEFLDRVFTEIAGLFPYGYIHIGGDECTKKFWKECADCQNFMKKEGLKDEKELQSYFIKKVEKIVESKGKKMIGWDEILEGGLSPNATVMSWQEMKGGIEAAKQGHSVVMTPWSKCYIDLYQGDMAAEPKTYGMSRLTSTYNWDPVPEGINPNLILGGQANLWTESVPNTSHAQYMTWPRGMALAEVYWSAKERKNWPDFVSRVESHFERFDMACINYAESMFDPILSITKKTDNGKTTVELSNEMTGIDIHYSTDNTFPDKNFPKYENPIELPKGAYFLRLASYKNGKKVGKMISIRSEELERRAKKVP